MASLKDIYKKSSLVMHPAAMKDGKLYSQVPHSGNGDFTFSRANGVQTRVNKHGLIEAVADNTPRLSYDIIDGEVADCPHLLLEPSRENLVANSDDMSDFSYTSAEKELNSGIAPDGTNTAIKLKDDNSGGTSFVRIFKEYTVSTSSDYQMSVFMKAGTLNYAGLRTGGFTTPANGDTVFNLSDGTIHSQSAAHTRASIENYGNGWYRCSIGFTTDSTDTTGNFVIILADNSGNPNTVPSDGTSNALIWGAQFEKGTYATSYIPTSGSTAQRQLDTCYNSGTSAEFNDSEGVLFVEFAALHDELSHRRISISDGTTGNLVYVSFDTTSNRILANANGKFLNYIATDITEFHKVAVYYNSTAPKLYVNGVLIETETAMTAISGLNELAFDNGVGGNTFYGKVKQVVVFNEALTDAELQTLTS